MNPKGTVTQQDADLIEAARAQRDAADENWRAVVLEVAARSSVREAAKVARISPNTIMLWKKQN